MTDETSLPAEACCDSMAGQLAWNCPDHISPWDCPDALIVRTGTGWGIQVRDGGSSSVEISRCPWCGALLHVYAKPGSDLEDRDALIERVAEAFHGHLRNNVAAGTLQDYTRGARAVLALLEAEGWGPVEAQDAVIARQAAALIALSQDPGGDLVSRRDIEARHEAVTNQLRAALARSRTEVERLRELLGSLWLYVDWRYCTRQLTTEQKETWAAAVEAWQRDLHKDDQRALAELHPADRWWLCPTCGPDIRRGRVDGPHEGCMYAHEEARTDG